MTGLTRDNHGIAGDNEKLHHKSWFPFFMCQPRVTRGIVWGWPLSLLEQ